MWIDIHVVFSEVIGLAVPDVVAEPHSACIGLRDVLGDFTMSVNVEER